MKTLIFSTLAAVLLPLVAVAQAPAQVKKILNSLPPEERQQYEAAYEKALLDPAVVSATEDKDAAIQNHKEVLKAAIIAIDPSLESLVDAKKLDPADRKKLAAATAKVRTEPNVKSANAKRMKADTLYRAELSNAILKVDPTVAPIMDKLNGKAPASPAANAEQSPATPTAPAEQAPAAQ